MESGKLGIARDKSASIVELRVCLSLFELDPGFPRLPKRQWPDSDAAFAGAQSHLFIPSRHLRTLPMMDSGLPTADSESTIESSCLQSHPINKTFPEILSLIFLQGHYSSANYVSGWTRKGASPLIWMQVCKHWRNVALNTPELWSTLSFNLSIGNPDLKTNLARQWLGRAKSHPLRLSLLVGSSPWGSRRDTVLDAFLERAQFWQHIDLKLPESAWRRLENQDNKAAMPFLKSVTLAYSDTMTTGSRQQIRFFESTPSLTTVHIELPMHSTSVKVDWQRITKCSMLLGLNPANMLTSMHSMVNLTLMIKPESVFPTHEFIAIPSLRTLEFVCYGGQTPIDLWEILRLPALYDIRFTRNWSPNGQSWATQIFPYISRWSTTVRRISLCNAHLADDELHQVINYIPLIEKIEIAEDDRTDYVTNEFMESLTLTSREVESDQSAPSVIAPNLQWIGFKGFYYQFDDAVFVKMVESRWNSPYVTTYDPGAGQVRRLRGIMLKPERSLERRANTRLAELKQEGLRVELFLR